MNLRNYIYLGMVFLFAGTITSCSDWLDYNPKDRQTANSQFSTRSGFYSSVNGVYNNLLSGTLYGANLTYGMLDLMGKRYYTGSISSSLKYKYSHYNYTDDDVSDAFSSLWSAAYSNILNANVILQAAEQQKGVLSDRDVNLIKGEMLALRAFLHFDILRLFGPIYSVSPEAVSIPYNNSAEAQSYDFLPLNKVIYDCLIPDLTNAENCLRQSDPIIEEGVLASEAEAGDNYMRYRQLRLNYYATILLKARVYLWAGDMENALVEAKKITDNAGIHTIFPFVDSDRLLGNSVNPDRVFSTEVLFGAYNDNLYDAYTDNFDGANLGDGTVLQPRSSYIETVFPNQADYRFQSQWSAYGSTYNFTKFREISFSENSMPFYVYFMPFMRLSEAYYIAAEASLETDLGAAITYLNTILAARGITTLQPTATSKEVLDEIKSEYIRETWGEGQIFYLFKRLRMNITSAYNGEAAATTSASSAIYVVPMPVSEQENR